MISLAQQLPTPRRFEASRRQFEELLGVLSARNRGEMKHAEAEEWLLEQGLELMQKVYQDWLAQLGCGYVGPAVTGNDGIVRLRQTRLAPILSPLVCARLSDCQRSH